MGRERLQGCHHLRQARPLSSNLQSLKIHDLSEVKMMMMMQPADITEKDRKGGSGEATYQNPSPRAAPAVLHLAVEL